MCSKTFYYAYNIIIKIKGVKCVLKLSLYEMLNLNQEYFLLYIST